MLRCYCIDFFLVNMDGKHLFEIYSEEKKHVFMIWFEIWECHDFLGDKYIMPLALVLSKSTNNVMFVPSSQLFKIKNADAHMSLFQFMV